MFSLTKSQLHCSIKSISASQNNKKQLKIWKKVIVIEPHISIRPPSLEIGRADNTNTPFYDAAKTKKKWQTKDDK